MPKLVFINDKAVLIECEFPPQQATNDEATIQAVEKISAEICVRCGYYRDASLRHLNILCFHPSNPALPILKKKLEETGTF